MISCRQTVQTWSLATATGIMPPMVYFEELKRESRLSQNTAKWRDCQTFKWGCYFSHWKPSHIKKIFLLLGSSYTIIWQISAKQAAGQWSPSTAGNTSSIRWRAYISAQIFRLTMNIHDSWASPFSLWYVKTHCSYWLTPNQMLTMMIQMKKRTEWGQWKKTVAVK